MHLSQEHAGEHYTKRFDAWTHSVVMLYAVIKHFDSLREIAVSLLAEAPKLQHLGLSTMSYRSTLSDANKRRPEAIFAAIYRHIYAQCRHELSSDSRKQPQWLNRLQIIDSTTITLFSNLIFKGVGRHPKLGKKKGGIKAHSIIHANERVPCDIQKGKLTTLLTNDLETDPYELIQVYRTRWEIELLFKQMKQNFPLRYFYGESAHALKIQIWVTLLANLLFMVLKARLKRTWSFSGLATIVRIYLMYYADVYTLLEHPERD